MSGSSVLHRIADQVRARVAEDRARDPRPRPTRQPRDFKAALERPGVQVISEVKLASPSEGDIAPGVDPVVVAGAYLAAGAAALSVLTERDSFKGHPDYLRAIRAAHPDALLLMKDFMLAGADGDYQLDRALADGADAILVIVALLGAKASAALHAKARARGLTALVEVHDEAEMKIAVDFGAPLIGVNNRNLKTLDVSLDVSERMASLAPPGTTLVAESGIRTGADVHRLQGLGYRAFLVGTSLMRTGKPGLALAALIAEAAPARAGGASS